LISDTRRPCATKRGISRSMSVVLPLPDQPAKPNTFNDVGRRPDERLRADVEALDWTGRF